MKRFKFVLRPLILAGTVALLSFTDKDGSDQNDDTERKFWGKGPTTCTTVTNGAGDPLYQNCCYHYYIAWIDTGVTCYQQ
jgi:hypothetical protein